MVVNKAYIVKNLELVYSLEFAHIFLLAYLMNMGLLRFFPLPKEGVGINVFFSPKKKEGVGINVFFFHLWKK